MKPIGKSMNVDDRQTNWMDARWQSEGERERTYIHVKLYTGINNGDFVETTKWNLCAEKSVVNERYGK